MEGHHGNNFRRGAGYSLRPRYIEQVRTNTMSEKESDSTQKRKINLPDLKNAKAQLIDVPASEEAPVDELTATVAKIAKLQNYLQDSGRLAQLKDGRVPKDEISALAELVDQLNDLRAREIEIRLAQVKSQIDGAAK